MNAVTAASERVAMPGASSAAQQRRVEVDPLALRERGDARLGPVADAALGHVEDPPQVHGVVGIRQHAQVGQRVLDLAALVEPRAADHLVRQADPDEDLLERAGLRVGPVEHRDVAGPRLAGVASAGRSPPR